MKFIFWTAIILFTTCSCINRNQESDSHDNLNDSLNVRNACNAVYFWKTTFSLTEEDRDFLKEHNIKSIYVRYFDIYRDKENDKIPVPEATIRFKDTIPENIEIIPTVFIDNDLFKVCDMNEYISRIIDRIITMTNTNDIKNVREVQLDCDWTKTTEIKYFDFLKIVRQKLKERNLNLSVTIRLHQLKMKIPPIDRGVLMCYNTGAVLNSKTYNSILNESDVKPYAKYLSSYDLPLDIAYPTFAWAVWFENGKFKALLRNAEPNNENLIHKEGNTYRVKNGFYQEGHYIAADNEIRFENSDFDNIMNIKKLLEPQIEKYSIIIYHLDSKNLSKYTSNEINKIYNN